MSTHKHTQGMIACVQCGGTGIMDRYMHIADGVCFRCMGKGTVNAPRPGSKLWVDDGITPNPKFKNYGWHPDYHGRKGIPEPEIDWDALH